MSGFYDGGGERKATPLSYEGGAARSEAKPDYHLVNPQFNRLVAEAMTEGRKTKGEYNYRSGGPEFIKSCYAHAMEHLFGIIEDSENAAEHIGHAAANLNMLTYFLERRGDLDVLGDAAILTSKERRALADAQSYEQYLDSLHESNMDDDGDKDVPAATKPKDPSSEESANKTYNSIFSKILEKFTQEGIGS